MRKLLILIPLSWCLIANGQDEITLDEISENLLMSDSEIDDPGNVENMTQLMSHKLDLNKIDHEHLASLNILSEIQIQNFFAHREVNGKLISIHELQSIDGFDVETIKNLQKFVTVREITERLDKSILSRLRNESENYVMLRYEHNLENKKGFAPGIDEDQKFLGQPGRMSLRIRSYRPGDFSFGITSEKDPGEKFIWSPKKLQYGFDYTSVHFQLINKGQIKNLILGDFQSQFGQGLIWGGGMGFGKGSETITNIRRSNLGFLPYTSAYESGNMRGLASTISVSKNINISSAYSFTRRDATIQDDFNGETASSFQFSGLHRNRSELQKRKTVEENIMGTIIEYNRMSLTAGTTFQHVGLSTSLEPRSSLYNQFSFRGNTLNNIGLFINYNLNNFSFFTEAAQTIGGGKGLVLGSLVSLTRKLDLSLLYRAYDRNFNTLYGNAFSENTRSQNESGVYWGWKYKFNRKFQHSGYIDVFRFPWLKFRTYSPTDGNEWLLRLQWQPSRSQTFFVQARQENKWRNISEESPVYKLSRISKNNYWLNMDYTLSPGLKMKSRIQYSNIYFNGKFSEGFVILQDISFQLNKLKCTVRYALFDTDDYDNRQYVYEHDVWLAYSLPAYNGQGVRKYILIQYKLNKMLTCWLRYSHTRYNNRETIGSGMDMINGNEQNDIKFEVRLKF